MFGFIPLCFLFVFFLRGFREQNAIEYCIRSIIEVLELTAVRRDEKEAGFVQADIEALGAEILKRAHDLQRGDARAAHQ